MNTMIICKLSVLQHARSAPPGLTACESDTLELWMCDVLAWEGGCSGIGWVQGGFSCMKEVWPSSTATQRASLPVGAVGGEVHCSPLGSAFRESSSISCILPFQSFFPFTSAVMPEL